MKKLSDMMRSVLFLLGLILLLVVSSLVFSTGQDTYNVIAVDAKQRSLKEEQADSIDVLFAGDSECYSAFNPLRIWVDYGITSFVCGTSAQRLCDTYALLQACFETQSPEVIILETNCLFRFAGVNKDTDDKYLQAVSRCFPVFQYHSRWKTYLAKDTSDTKESKMKGFRLRKGIKSYEGGEYMIWTEEERPVEALAQSYLEKILELCKEKNAKLILVSAPSAKNWNYKKHNGVSRWAKEYEVPYLDLNLEEALEIDWKTDTKDGGDHLNYAGAEKVSKYIGNYLQTTWKIADHREDKEYEHWYENCELLN